MTAGLETFAKVRALHDRASTPGEKAAAASRMEALARTAGMTVAEAVSKLDRPKPMTQAEATAAAFNDLFNSPEVRAYRAEQEAKRLVKCREILTRYATEDAVFADTPREAALRAACAHLYEPDPKWEGAYRLAGWGELDGRDRMPASVREAVCQGWPLPETVAQAWAEFEDAERHEGDRCAINGGDYNPHSWVEARRYVLEEMLDSLPARSMRDLRARLAWMQYVIDLGFSRPVERDQACLNALRGDVDRMGERIRTAERGADLRSTATVGKSDSDHPATPAESHVQFGRGQSQAGEMPSNLRASQPGLKSQPQQDNSNLDRATDAVLRPSRETPPGGASPRSGKYSRSPNPAPSPVQSGQGQGSAQCAYPSRRTNAEKRRAVLDLLRTNADDPGNALSDREIARRAGVSPQTVGNIRRAQP